MSHTEVQLRSHDGAPGREQPTQPIVIAVQHQDIMQVHLAQPGCFLFEILVQMQLPLIRKVIDLTGKILPVDLRVWHPMAVKTLDEAPWTLRPGSFRCANGFPHTAHFGLHDGQVWCGLQNLIQAVTPPAHAVFAIHPAFAQALLDNRLSTAHANQMRKEYS